MRQYRQGDILLIQLDTAPEDLGYPEPRSDGRVVLALGEATGHAHAIASPAATLFEREDGARHLRVDAACELTHEEHAPVPLVPGTYRVIRQREYHGALRWGLVRD